MTEVLPASFFVPLSHAAARSGLSIEDIKRMAEYHDPNPPCFETPIIRSATSRRSGEMLVDLADVQLIADAMADSGLLNRSGGNFDSPL
jgi:hypothetical protein